MFGLLRSSKAIPTHRLLSSGFISCGHWQPDIRIGFGNDTMFCLKFLQIDSIMNRFNFELILFICIIEAYMRNIPVVRSYEVHP